VTVTIEGYVSVSPSTSIHPQTLMQNRLHSRFRNPLLGRRRKSRRMSPRLVAFKGFNKQLVFVHPDGIGLSDATLREA
jgi:hypothetical protein